MKIENGSLVVTVQGVEKTVPLPTVAADAKVKAWAVPADYRADGLFVAVTVNGESEVSIHASRCREAKLQTDC